MKTLRNSGIAIIASLLLGLTILTIGIIKYLPLILANPSGAEEIIKNAMSPAYLIITALLGVIITVVIYLGYISLGKKLDNNFLAVIAWISLALIIINNLINTILSINHATDTAVIFGILSGVSIMISYIFLGIGVYKLKNKIRLAKTTGLLYIIGAATTIILIGAIILFIAQIFAVVMFFKASKKLEKNS